MKKKISLLACFLMGAEAFAATTLTCKASAPDDVEVIGTPKISISGRKVMMLDEGERYELFCEPLKAGHLICEKQVTNVDIEFDGATPVSAEITVGDGKEAAHGECR